MLKKQRASCYMALAAAACALISLALFVASNMTVGYAILNAQWAIAATAVAAACAAGSAVLQAKGVNELIVSVLRLAAIFLIMAAVMILLIDRAVVAGGLFTWNGLDTYAWQAFYTGVACAVFQLLGVLLVVVSAFMKQGKAA